MKEQKNEQHLDKIRGCLIGGAAGDALGYAVEFMGESSIFARYGKGGIRAYELDPRSSKALISDDTQMTLFTANGLLFGETRAALRGIGGQPSMYMLHAYKDWLRTQDMTFAQAQKDKEQNRGISWLADVPDLYHRRAPGNTCLSALYARQYGECIDYINHPLNQSKGCGGLMRIAPMGLKFYPFADIKTIDKEGAELAAITHGHSLGYMPAAVLTHIINRSVYAEKEVARLEIVEEARDAVAEIFADDPHIRELTDLINLAITFSQNQDRDLDNIHRLGEGWVGDEALAIAIYCALRHQNDFSAGIIAAINHRGDSDSTGAITGNILGAWLGFDAIDDRWKKNLELYNVILEMADDLCSGCQMSEYSSYRDPDWVRKYCRAQWKAQNSKE